MTGEQDILAAYNSDIKGVFSIHELSRRLGKAYPYVHRNVHKLVEKGILKKAAMGRSHLCSVNLRNKQAVLLLALNELQKHEHVPVEMRNRAREIEETQSHDPVLMIIYAPNTNELLVVHDKEEETYLTREELKKRLIEDEKLYEKHIVLAGYENFYSLLTEAEIERRYHPLL